MVLLAHLDDTEEKQSLQASIHHLELPAAIIIIRFGQSIGHLINHR